MKGSGKQQPLQLWCLLLSCALACTLSCHAEPLGLYARCKAICRGTPCWINHFFFSVSLSGVQVQCNSCKTSANPQYHLAMSDGSVRNFCSYNCVVAFQVWYLGFLLSSINRVINQILGVLGKIHSCKIRLFFWLFCRICSTNLQEWTLQSYPCLKVKSS